MERLKDLENIFENMIDIVFFLSLDGSVIYANRSAREFYEYNEEEFKQLKLWDIDKNEKKFFEKDKNRLFEIPDKVVEIEATHTSRSGSTFPVKVCITCVTAKTDRNKVLINMVYNMEQIKTISRLNRVLELSINIVNDAVLIFDLDFSISFWNKKAENLFGITENKLTQENMRCLVPEDKQEELNILKNKLRKKESVARYRSVRMNGQGERIELFISYIPYIDYYDQLRAYIGIYTEVTDEDICKLELEEFQKKSAKALEGGYFGIWDYNFLTKKAEVLNNMWSDKTVHYRDKMSIAKHMEVEDVNNIFHKLQQLNKSNDRIDVEYRIKNCNYTDLKWGRGKGRILEYDKNGSPLRMVGTFENITERKKIEMELKRKQEQLQNMVALAVKSNRLKDLFLANMSHEIKTPLNGIIVAIELIKKEDLNSIQKELFSFLENSARSLETTISNAIECSDYEADNMTLEITRVNLAEITKNAIISIQMSANKKGLATGFYCDPGTQKFYFGDGKKIRQCLDNLISNAVKFTSKGWIKLRIKLVQEEDNYADIVFEICDTGSGIRADLQEYIFDQFFQDGINCAEINKGTGLGLAITKKYARMMGGDLTFYSQEKVGSTFRLQCRLYKSESDFVENSMAGN